MNVRSLPVRKEKIGTPNASFAAALTGPLEEHSVNDSPLTPLQPTTTDTFAKVFADEETLVADHRAGLSPSQQVEQKLIGMLKASPLLVSHVQRRLKPGPR